MFNTELALVDLFRYPTIGLLAEHVEQHVEPDSFELEPEFTESLKQGRSRLQGRLAQSRTAVIEVEQEQVQ
jgi:hypothetical protein